MAESWQYNTFLPHFVAATSFGVVLGPVVAFFFLFLLCSSYLSFIGYSSVLVHCVSLVGADITRAPSLLLPVSLSFLDIFLHYATCVSESWRNMQSVDAYTMFMAWTLAPHMVDTQSQTALFKSVIPVPSTPKQRGPPYFYIRP